MDNINSLIKKTTDIDLASAANPNLKDTDVVHIWDEVSLYIERLMSQTKGVSIPNFGTFSFVQKKIDIGNSKYVLVQRPVFVIAEKFAQTHGLTYTKNPVTGSIPVHPLNYTVVANETAFSRDDIESCVRHVLQVFNRSVQARKNVEFTFNGIGKLQIRNSKVKMKFFKDFVSTFDASGKVVADMQNRPNTADSVMSRNDMSRAHTRNTCILPRLNSRAGAMSALDNNLNNNNGGAMDTINEEYAEEKNHAEESSASMPIASIYSTEDAMTNGSVSLLNMQQSLEVRPATSYRIPNAFNVKPTPSINPPLTQNEQEALNSALNDSATTSSKLFPSNSKLDAQAILTRPSSRTLIGNLSKPNTATGSNNPSPQQCIHHNHGQELCYLCHQRQRRNVPVYLHEEMRQKELEEEQLLAQYQHLKDMEKQLKDEEKRNVQRLDRAKIDAFNLGVSEAVKLKKQERPKTSDMSRSFIFRKRVRTPPKFYKQQELSEHLAKQIDSKQKETLNAKQELEYLEKMEQMQLAEDLAAQREAYLKEKQQKQKDLKHSLDTLVRTKEPQVPRAYADSEVFGQYDAKNEKLVQMKRREVEGFRFNKIVSEQKKREELLGYVKEQERDFENIERVKEELRIDRATRYNRMIGMRKDLEKDWMLSNEEKRNRDKDEREHRMAHDGLLVHEQCDKYKRCEQCQRDVKNCGESNIWSDTRYVPGTRLMA